MRIAIMQTEMQLKDGKVNNHFDSQCIKSTKKNIDKNTLG